MLCHCACKHVRLSCVLNKLLTYLLTCMPYARENAKIPYMMGYGASHNAKHLVLRYATVLQ